MASQGSALLAQEERQDHRRQRHSLASRSSMTCAPGPLEDTQGLGREQFKAGRQVRSSTYKKPANGLIGQRHQEHCDTDPYAPERTDSELSCDYFFMRERGERSNPLVRWAKRANSLIAAAPVAKPEWQVLRSHSSGRGGIAAKFPGFSSIASLISGCAWKNVASSGCLLR